MQFLTNGFGQLRLQAGHLRPEASKKLRLRHTGRIRRWDVLRGPLALGQLLDRIPLAWHVKSYNFLLIAVVSILLRDIDGLVENNAILRGFMHTMLPTGIEAILLTHVAIINVTGLM